MEIFESVIFELSNIVNEVVTSTDINYLMTEISNIFLESANDTFGTFDKTGRKSHCNFSRKHEK